MRFNTIFLLKATAVTALACLPMAFDRAHGYVFVAFTLPLGWAVLAAMEVKRHGEFELKFKQIQPGVVELYTTGGRQSQWLAHRRIIGVGILLALAIGISLVNSNPTIPNRGMRLSPEQWIPLAALMASIAFLGAAISTRRTVRTNERQFVTEFLLFGRFRCLRLRWEVREGDYLAVFTAKQTQRKSGETELQFDFQHALCVCRSHRRQVIAVGHFTSERVVPGMEIVARRVAKLVDLPFVGYRPWKGFWWLW